MNILLSVFLQFLFLPFQSNPNMMTRVSHPPLHDVDAYDKAGPYEIIRRPDAAIPLDQIDKMRGWLWAHWTERRLALLIVIRYSVEGDRSTYYYYIEPDVDGRWRTAVKLERLEYNYKYKDPDCKRYREQYSAAYSLVRTELETDEAGNHKAIPTDQTRPPATYLLSFKDENGKEIATF